ncbi:DnaB-like helicase C-terminal domain-containing protein [Succinimonas sp.]|uniref:DnaB-like helicase C-terminal domain-containing protein n=1 Tax=Succinimonas sp. TaxID=1936151 RepID=UPI003869D44C
MNQEPIKEPNQEYNILKEYLMDYLQQQIYYNPSRKYANKFLCLNPNHQEARPSMSVNKKNNTCHCFSCGATYSIIDLVIKDYEIGDLNEPLEERLKNKENIAKACNKIKELFNISGEAPHKKDYNQQAKPKPQIDLNEVYKKGVLGNPTTEYLKDRGINSYDLIKTLGLKNTYEQDGNGYLIIPYQIKGDIKTLTKRTISLGLNKDINTLPKELRYKHFGAMTNYDPFNYLESNQERAIFITEGEIDSISIYQVLEELKKEGFNPSIKIGSIALGGINNNRDLIKKLEYIRKDNLTFILALDNDSRGEEATKSLSMTLYEAKIPFISHFTPKAYKDSNDYLKADLNGFKERVKNYIKDIKELSQMEALGITNNIEQEQEKEKQEYINSNNVLNYLPNFMNHIENPIRPIKTYFEELDKILKGGLRPGLITIGAISSLGKTSFILQLADQIAQSQQRDILYYSLEMATDELIAKSLSRLMYLNSFNRVEFVKSQAEILNPSNWSIESKELYSVSFEDYKTYSNKLFIKEGVYNLGVEDIRTQALKHKELTSKAPLIIIDYLQILASPKDKKGLSDKQKTDENILLLKQLSRDLETPIIVISSLNRASYSLDVSLESFKESGTIEYTSDLILGLNYALNDSQLEELKTIRKDSQNLPENEKQKRIEEFYKKVRSKTPREIKIDILKNRNGESNKSIKMLFYPQLNYFKEDGATLEAHKNLLSYARDKANQDLYNDLPF